MLKFFRLPFAATGDKTAVPDAVDSNGNVSYSQGYGFDYQRQKTDPAAKNIERDKMNQVLFDITTAIAEIQSQGAPDYITSALNGGAAYSYAQFAIVKYSGALYISLVAANTALPSDATKWALLPTPALLQQAAYMSATAGGTVDAITAAFTPAIAALPAAPGTLSVFVRANGANATTTPTFKADGTTAKTIVKGNNVALLAGDIAGAGHWLELQYDATLDKWVLQNPTYGVGAVTVANDASFADNSVKPASTGWVRGAMAAIATAAGFVFNTGVNGYIKFPSWLGSLIIQWTGVTRPQAANAFTNFTFPIAFPNVFFAAALADNYTVSAAGYNNVAIVSRALSGAQMLCTGNSIAFGSVSPSTVIAIGY